MKVGFDFDGTFTNFKVRSLAKLLIKYNHKVYIITSRSKSYDNADLLSLIETLKIPFSKVYFTNKGPKSNIIKNLQIEIFMDNDITNIEEINKNTKAQTIYFNNLKPLDSIKEFKKILSNKVG